MQTAHSLEESSNIVTTIDCNGRSDAQIKLSIQRATENRAPLMKLIGLDLERIERPTPSHWIDNCATPNDARFEQLSNMLGNVFGYSDLQNGRLVQEVFPIRGDARKQVGSGAIKLELHTEDPILDYRADYLGFMCLSNRDRIPTTVAVPDFALLSETTRLTLCDTKFTIFSDRPTPTPFKPAKLVTSVLLRAPGGRLRMIYDPVYIDYAAMDAGQSAAFRELQELIDSAMTEFLLKEGDVGFVDNYQVAHGRPQYVPRYDGTDRWLKRTQISSNLVRFSAIAVGENALP